MCAEATVKGRIGGAFDGVDVADLTNDAGVGVSIRHIAYITMVTVYTEPWASTEAAAAAAARRGA